MNPFVGVKKVSSADELKQLLDSFPSPHNYYFLRWHHKVSGIQKKLEEFPCPEGQMFNPELELRWKQKGQNFDVLLLSTTEPNAEHSFKKVGEEWVTQQRQAHIYPSTETRFPKGFNSTDIKIAQRYFFDKQTSTVHFVALTVQEK